MRIQYEKDSEIECKIKYVTINILMSNVSILNSSLKMNESFEMLQHFQFEQILT